MTTVGTKYRFSAQIFLWQGQAAWHFIAVPKNESADIKQRFSGKARGWGSLPVFVMLGECTWKTSIFPDKKSGQYLLPLRAIVRKNEGLFAGDTVQLTLEIQPL
jgi:hypothetical protein